MKIIIALLLDCFNTLSLGNNQTNTVMTMPIFAVDFFVINGTSFQQTIQKQTEIYVIKKHIFIFFR